MTHLPPRRHALISLLMMAGAFAAVTVIAELLGAANLGTAMAFGQLGFAATLVYVLLRR